MQYYCTIFYGHSNEDIHFLYFFIAKQHDIDESGPTHITHNAVKIFQVYQLILFIQKSFIPRLKVKALQLSKHSEREATATLQQLVGLQMKRINIKLDHWQRMQQIMQNERHQVGSVEVCSCAPV